jgi:hypothetical protein
MAHDVDVGLFPGDESAVMPDVRGGLDGHESGDAPSLAPSAYRTGYRDTRQPVTE